MKFQKNKARFEINIRLGFIDGPLEELDLKPSVLKHLKKIKDIKTEWDTRMGRVLHSIASQSMPFYTSQLLSRPTFIQKFDNYIKNQYSPEDAIDEMADQIFPHINIRETTIAHYTTMSQRGEVKKKDMEQFDKELSEYVRSNTPGELIKEFSMDTMREIIASVLKQVGRDSAIRTGGIIRPSASRVLHYRSLAHAIRVQKNFGAFTSESQTLLSSAKVQVNEWKRIKYLTATYKPHGHAKIDLVREFVNFQDAVTAVIKESADDELKFFQQNPDMWSKFKTAYQTIPAVQRTALNMKSAAIRAKLDYTAQTDYPVPKTIPSKLYTQLNSLYSGTSLGGTITTCVLNDSVTTAILTADTFKSAVTNFLSYCRTIGGLLNEDEKELVFGSIHSVRASPFMINEHELNSREITDGILSNGQIAEDARTTNKNIVNVRIAQEVLTGEPGEVVRRVNLWAGTTDTSWFYKLVRGKDRYISTGSPPHIQYNLIEDTDLRIAIATRIEAFVDIAIPESNLTSNTAKYKSVSLPFYLDRVVHSVLLFKSPMITELGTSIKMAKLGYKMYSGQLEKDYKFLATYFGMSLFQSFVFHYFKAHLRGEEVSDKYWKKFLLNVLIDSPIFGVSGDFILDFLSGQIGQSFTGNIKSPLIPLLKALTAIPNTVTGGVGKGAYTVLKNLDSFSVVRNYPVLSAIWQKRFLASIFDALYPDNKYLQTKETYLHEKGLTYGER